MKRKLIFAIAAACLISCGKDDSTPRSVELFNEKWQFAVADDSATAFATESKNWRTLDLPHDWSIEGEFDENNPSTVGCGALPGGYGVYKKELILPQDDKNKQISIVFDGVYWQSTVYVNNQKVGYRPSGYSSFEYNITNYLHFDNKPNQITVTVDNVDMPNSRWYSGCGIYRNVYIKKTNPIHLLESETFVTTPSVNEANAYIEIATAFTNPSQSQIKATIVVEIQTKDGRTITREKQKVKTQDSITPVNLKFQVLNPALWSPETPNLYTAKISLKDNIGNIVDNYKTDFGIRYFSFEPEKGFYLNGKPTKINGVCQHHDLGALGSAINFRALERQLQILKEMGCNAIRTSHNMPAPELLQLTDSMGFIVMDEAFDMWRKRKTKYDYSQHFPQWFEKDLSDFIKRDRNHPSVIMWSIGNEILEQWNDINTDTLDIAQANLMFNFAAQMSKEKEDNSSQMHVNSLLAQKLVSIVKSIDPTRPVTSGNNETEPTNLIFKSNAMDIIGFNYHEYNWGDAFLEKYPGKPLIITEAVSALQTRGTYITPADTEYLWPARWDLPFEREGNECSAYDNTRAPWGSTHETTLKEYMAHPWVSGIFVWTGFDYIGEPTPYGWPSRSSYFGIIDLAGFPKDVYYLYQSLWTNKDVLHILPHWNWNEGDSVDVWAYTNYDEVELFINGVSQGVKSKQPGELHLSWKTAFQPGTLKAVGKKNNGLVTTCLQQNPDVAQSQIKVVEIKTADQPAKLEAIADRQNINNDGLDLSFVTINITDKDGNICPLANNMLKFSIDGPGEIAGLDNGCQTCLEPFKGNSHSAFHGKCLAIIRAKKGQSGTITLKIEAEGLQHTKIEIN